MTRASGWHIELKFRESGAETRALALVRLPDGTELRADGHADKHPDDPELPQVGEEIAAARLLNGLAQQLLDKAAKDIEAVTHSRASVRL
ncbi:DUF1876 domain-containing protein [Streptomyces sp. ACA25]|uniref:DUF1876 domain-containing protein n=1 Tax=Streptomyces sp. ACA25 TaxID=3022596 RepID=UPI002307EEA2|nr:DUF1876 domain-containing protein [Streptomyces sp. ACA25]MDB1089199.1 DUF1876 domain-containing protein [Streptomyces sp. ACA25]